MIVVSPLHELDAAIARWRPSHIVSLASPGAARVDLPSDVETLRLLFHDIAAPSPRMSAVTPRDVRQLLAFGGSWRGERPLLVHCWAGVSRSPAVAYILSCARSTSGNEEELAQRLRAAAPFATPNPRLVALADKALHRHGAMSSAVNRIGRGAETSLGSTFVLG